MILRIIDQSQFCPALSKIMERAAHRQLSLFSEEQNLLTKYQFGYRSNRSTTTSEVCLLQAITAAQALNFLRQTWNTHCKAGFAVWLDTLAMAFAYVNRC